MTTDYNPIAEQYQRSKQQPWRTFIEAHSLLELVGDPTGLMVLDMACGEGFYSRMIRKRGAGRLIGVDLSAEMIALARRQESAQQLGIEYVQGDARTLELDEPCDLVVAAYLLNYARDRQELQEMCDAIARCLKPGGRFVTINSSPLLNFPLAPSFRKYGFETTTSGPWQEGSPIKWTFHLETGSFDIENYFLDVAVHEQAFRAAGFRETRWHAPKLSPTAHSSGDAAYWADILTHSPVALIECVK